MNWRARGEGPSGKELQAARKAAGLSQSALAAKAGIGRHAVSYWECKARIDPRGWAVRRMVEAEPRIRALLQDWAPNTHARGMGPTLPDYSSRHAGARAGDGSFPRNRIDAIIEASISHALFRMMEKKIRQRARRRVTCGAKTTRKGTPCRNKSEPGRRRCKFHGGKSTGPRTPEGRARIAEAQRRRWARWREARGRRCLADA